MIKRIISSIQMTGRVLKNLLLRPFRVINNKLTHFFSGGKVATALPGMVKKLPKILKTKPEKAEDYFDWGSIYVAKSLVVTILVLLILIPLLYIFILHPLLTSWFWVKDFHTEDTALSDYNGRVRVYYDTEFKDLQFEGRLSDGSPVEDGIAYYENGRLRYDGSFEDGDLSGQGILYYEDGSVRYRGSFEKGKFNGVGSLTDEDGRIYTGTFVNGLLEGSGSITVGETISYSGDFVKGVPEGNGKQYYSNGAVQYSGAFSGGVPHGMAMEYTEDGVVRYNGMFTSGVYNGDGVLYTDNGEKLYSGSFEMGKYSGAGTIYGKDGKLYSGEFEKGLYNGIGTLYGSDGSITTGSFTDGEISATAECTYINGMRYEGCFDRGIPDGEGTLTNVTGSFRYMGMFDDGDFDYSRLIGQDSSAVSEMIPSLKQRIDTDCFYLEDNDFGMAVKFSFATEASPAAAVEVYTRPFAGSCVIKSAEDITADSALSVSKTDKQLDGWAEKKFGVYAEDLVCYAAVYKTTTSYYWVDKNSGELKLKSADGTIDSSNTSGSADTSGTELTFEEIEALFEEVGLDIRDFESLGFVPSDEE